MAAAAERLLFPFHATGVDDQSAGTLPSHLGQQRDGLAADGQGVAGGGPGAPAGCRGAQPVPILREAEGSWRESPVWLH